jgi:hypothetical protein
VSDVVAVGGGSALNPGGNGTLSPSADQGGAGGLNTGGGGGASNRTPNAGGLGGRGIVVLKYPNTFTISNPGGGLTLSTSTSGAYKITQITDGTGNVSWS